MARRLSFSEFMTHRATLAAEAVVAAFVPLLYYACRTTAHVYIDIYSFDGASQMIFWFMVADAIGVLAIAFLRWRAERFGGESLPKAYTACAVAAFFLTVVFMIVDFVMLGIMGSESSPIGEGIGKSLLCRAVDDYGVDELTVNEENARAVGFYEHMGFQPYNRSERDEQGGYHPILYMKKV